MYAGADFSPAETTESEVYTLDLANDLLSGETIASVIVTITVSSGSDANPSSHLDGTPGWVGSQVMQRLTGLVSGVTYNLQGTATTSLGYKRSLNSHVACIPPG